MFLLAQPILCKATLIFLVEKSRLSKSRLFWRQGQIQKISLMLHKNITFALPRSANQERDTALNLPPPTSPPLLDNISGINHKHFPTYLRCRLVRFDFSPLVGFAS